MEEFRIIIKAVEMVGIPWTITFVLIFYHHRALKNLLASIASFTTQLQIMNHNLEKMTEKVVELKIEVIRTGVAQEEKNEFLKRA